MPTDIEMDLPNRFWRSRAEIAEAEVRRLRADNERLREENETLRLYYKDWCQGHSYTG